MKNKSGFLTFCFAFIPGAGQMYQGYMKRGLSLIGLFCLFCWLAMAIGGLGIFLPVIWMYSFFDTFNLRGHLLTGDGEPDDYIIHLGAEENIGRLLEKRHNLVGWALVALGVYAIYDNFVRRIFWDIANRFDLYFISTIVDSVPTILLCAALIWVGLWLVRGPRSAKHETFDGTAEDIPYYTAPQQPFAPEAKEDKDGNE